MDKLFKNHLDIFIRYLSLLILMYIFLGEVFSEMMTSFLSALSLFFLNTFTTATLSEGIIFLPNNTLFLIVRECVTPSAYVLISMIFFTMPIKIKKLAKIWFYSILLFTLFNILRIFILMWVHQIMGTEYFDQFHLVFYQGLTGIVTALIVIYFLHKEKIKRIYPLFSDIRYLIKTLKKH